MVVIFTASSVYFMQDSEQAYYEYQLMIENGQRFASAYNLVAGAGKGFSYNMSFPTTILGYPYNVSFVENNSIVIEWEGPHGKMIYPHVMTPYSLEYGGCIDTSITSNRGVLKSDIGKNEISFINSGDKIQILQGGSCP
ncbi:MAG: hypothetical protein PHU63_03180 [Candidatus ainarchaeum sp.]|nr:hypothetical protein [Candidatus ainarchaeum sp.]